MLAAIAAMFLRRDSAATRHLVWLLAIVAMLVVPVLSAMLPQWRVLPQWAGIAPETGCRDDSSPSDRQAAYLPPQSCRRIADPWTIHRPAAHRESRPAAELPDARPASATPARHSRPGRLNWNWINALPFVWAIGFFVLILRLMAARWMLWNAERRVDRSFGRPGNRRSNS